MADVAWLSITSYCSDIGLVMSILSNCTLLILLSRERAKKLGSYKYLIATFSLTGMFYSAVEWFMRPLIHIYDDNTFIIQRKRFDYSRFVVRILFTTYCGCYATSFTLFAVHFIYRYLSVCTTDKVKYFEGYRFFFWLLGIFTVATSWAMFTYSCFPESDRTTSVFREVVTNSYNLNVSETDYVPYTYWMYENDVKVLNPINVMGLMQHLIIMIISFAISFFCGYRTAVFLRKTKVLSDRTKKLQKQLFKALVVQTIIPTIFMYIPTGMIFLLPFLEINIEAYGNLTIVAVHLYPGIDPLVLILVLKDFRKTLSLALRSVFKSTTQRIIVVSGKASSRQ